MMTKKVVGLLTAAMLVFGFAMSAQCQDTDNNIPFELDACENCKCPVKNVPCPETTVIVGEQGSTSTQVTPTCPFDYDNNEAGDLGKDYGYCASGSGTGLGTDRNCRVIFNVCKCPEACVLERDDQIGIQMTILTQGVYWAKDPKTWDDINGWDTVRFGIFGKNASTCAPYLQDKSFGRIKYYQTIEDKFNDKGKFIRIPRNEGTPAEGCLTSVPAANRVQVIESEIDTDYTITAADAGMCNFWIDIPAMRLDGTAKKGDAIKVRITLLWDRKHDSLCEDCYPPIMCECIRTVGIVCCDQAEVKEDEGCVFFPYVFQGLQDDSPSSWRSGIAVSALNRTALPENAKCTLTVQDTEGHTAIYEKTDMGNKLVWSFVLDDIIDKFAVVGGGSLKDGAVSLGTRSRLFTGT
jgi:hypothetical protein